MIFGDFFSFHKHVVSCHFVCHDLHCFYFSCVIADILSMQEYCSVLQLLCPDFPVELVQSAARSAGFLNTAQRAATDCTRQQKLTV